MTRKQALLRAYLIRKARRGKWDPRMCTNHGVSAEITRPCRRFVVRAYARGLIPTSTLRWPVSTTGSYHTRRNKRGKGKGVDVGLIPGEIGTVRGRRRMRRFQRREFRRWRRGKRRNMVELIGPLNRKTVLRGAHVPLSEGSALENQHDTHVHGAFS